MILKKLLNTHCQLIITQRRVKERMDIQELIDTLEEAQGPLDASIQDDVTASRVWGKVSDLLMELEALKAEG